MSDEDEFNLMAGHVRIIAEVFLTEQFGERCPDFEENCECCRRWAALDTLTEDPSKPKEPPHAAR